MYKRWQEVSLRHALSTRRILMLTGPRQCGKTTLAKALQTSNSLYRTLDDVNLLQVARLDPLGFVTHNKQFMIIDEVQRVPELLLSVKLRVDEDNRPGQYLLTGSANIYTLPRIQESLAGRVRHIRLRPLAQGEMAGTPPDFLQRACAQDWPTVEDATFNRQTILKLAFTGGYPEVLNLESREQKHWHRNYTEAILNQDMQQLLDIRRPEVVEKLLHTVAAWSGKYMNLNAIGSGLEVKRATLENYLAALESFYLLERLPPWTHGDYEYISKQFKLFMSDTGLMTAQLGWQRDQVELDADRSGKLIETFVYTQLAALMDSTGNECQLYHYRDRAQREIDFIVQGPAGELLGIEVKAGPSPGKGDIKHLVWFKENLAKDRPFVGIVLHTGHVTYRMGEGPFWAVPIASLWAK